MSNTPVLGLPQVSANQNSKETTVNDAILGLENATQASVSWNLAGGPITLTKPQFAQAFFHRLTGAATPTDFIVPNNTPRFFSVRNESVAAVNVIMQGGGAGSGLSVPPGETQLLFADVGTVKVYYITVNPATGGGAAVTAFTQLTDVPHAYTGMGGKYLAVKSDATQIEFVDPPAGGGAAFTDLTDTFSGYGTLGGKILRVKADETGLEAVDMPALIATIRDLDDVPDSFAGMAGRALIVKADESGIDFIDPAVVTGGVSKFSQLTDVPPDYAGSAGKLAAVNAGATGLEFIDPPTSLPAGGTAGQVLTKTSTADGDADWSDPPAGGADKNFGAHAYWRVFIVDTQGATSEPMRLQEIEMATVPNGPDQCSGGTAIASSFLSGSPPDLAFDNTDGNAWQANGTRTNEWIGYQFATPQTIREVRIKGSLTVAATTTPKNLHIDYSDDGITWTTALTPPAQTAWANAEWRKFAFASDLFTGLADVPQTYGGQARKGVRVKPDETGLEFIAQPASFGTFVAGLPTSSERLIRYIMTEAITFPVALAGSAASAVTAATAATSFLIRKNGVSFGTLDFAAGATAGTFTAATQTAFAPGDILEVIAPGTPDATLADFSLTLTGTRS